MVQFEPRGEADVEATSVVEAMSVVDAGYARALEELTDLQRRIDALQAERARRIADAAERAERVEIVSGSPTAKTAEYAHRSIRADLALALGVSEYTAERLVGEAETLVGSLPATLVAVECGEATWRAATLVAECAAGVGAGMMHDEAAARLSDYERAALDLARRVAPSRLRSRLMALRERLLAAPPVDRHRAAREERRVAIEDVEDGMSWLNAYLPSVEAHAIYHRLTDVARAAQGFDAEDGIGIDDPRTLDQRRADLLVDFVDGDHVGVGDEFERRIAQGRDFGRFAGIRPAVVVTVPVQALLNADRDPNSPPAMLDGTVPIDPATARQLVANAPSLYRLLVDPHTGARLDLSRTRYEVSTELRLWLRLRDETCRFPGCGHLAKGCDIDHSVDWQYGGETRADDLAHLCRGHHTLKHRTRWRLGQHPDGTITWRSPSGKIHSTKPAEAFARAA